MTAAGWTHVPRQPPFATVACGSEPDSNAPCSQTAAIGQELPFRHANFLSGSGHPGGPNTTPVANGECIRDHPGYLAGALTMSEGGGEEKVRGGTPTAFISYASQDAAVANSLVEALEQQGVRCWIAPRDVIPGSLYADGIVRAINGANVLVLVLSAHAVRSAHVGKEIERASSKRRPIIAIRTDSGQLTPAFEYFLSESQWIDLGPGGTDAAAAKLVEAVRRHLDPSVATPAPISTAATSAVPEKSVAVLPFVNMSEDRNNEHFSDGLSEELINLLTKIPDLRIPARTSSFFFKGKQTTVTDIAKALGVAYVMEGSVRKSGNRLRITVQLIRADNGYHVWSETYDRQLDDVFKIQDEIAGAVVRALKVSLLGSPIPRAAPTANAEAYSIFLAARYFTERFNPEDLNKALALYRRAIALDSNYAPAYASLAWCYEMRVAIGIDTDGVGYANARAAAERAIALDPNLPEGYLTLGMARYQYEFDFAAAAEMIGKAHVLDQNNAFMLQIAGHLALSIGTPADAGTYYARAAEQDPLNMLPRRFLAKALFYEDRLAEAETTLHRIIELNPQFPAPHYLLGTVLLARGEPNAALAAIEAEPSPQWKSFGLPLVYRALGREPEAQHALAALVANSAGTESQVAETYAYFGEPDQAFHWLEEARVRRDPGILHMRGNPLLRSLVTDPRYPAFLRKLKLPD
jgi:TolB-like protein/TPR repeat protein